MHFADELVEPEALHFPEKSGARKSEEDMAAALIKQMTQPWDPSRYKDDYKSALLDLIEKKAAGGPIKRAHPGRARAPSNVIDLTEVLRKSLSGAARKAPSGTNKRGARKRAAA